MGLEPGTRTGHLMHHAYIVVQVAGYQEVVAHELSARLTHGAGAVGVVEQVRDALRALLHGLDQVTRAAVVDLQWDAADLAANDGDALPQPLGDDEAEAFAER